MTDVSPLAQEGMPRHFVRRSILLPVIVVLAVHAYAMQRHAWRYQQQLSGFMLAPQKYAHEPEYAAVTWFDPQSGYDGQFYYVLSQAPLKAPQPLLDAPVRQLRIGYPVVCYIFSGGGQGKALIYVMPWVNLMCIGGMASLGAWWAKKHRLSPWWGAWLPIVTTMLSPTLRNLTDPLGLLTLFGLLLSWQERRTWLVIACAFATIFTREQNIAIAGLIGIAALWERRWLMAAGLVAVAVCWAGYVLALKNAYGEWPFLPSGGNLASPFVGLQYWWNYESPHSLVRTMRIVYAVFMIGQVLLLVFHIVRNVKRLSLLEVVGTFAVLMGVVAGVSIWEDWWSYSRNMALLPLIVWMLNVQARSIWGLVFGMLSGVLLQASIKAM